MVRSAVIALTMLSIFGLAGFFGGPLLSDEAIHAITGEPARAAEHGARGRITVATWNIDHGSGYDLILSALRTHAADVILLQEVDRFCTRSGNRDIARDLAHALDMNWVSAGEFQEIGESVGSVAAITGQAVLSRYPIESAATVLFSRQSTLRWRINPVQPRRGGRIALHARTAGVDVYSVHLESSGSDAVRDAQIKDVLGHDAWSTRRAAVIGGDFNNTESAMVSLLASVGAHGFRDALDAEDRQTSVRHHHPIDWLFTRGTYPSNGHVVRVGGVSDHFPLIATFDLSHEER